MGEKRDMSDDRYGCNKQYVMILLKYQAGKKKNVQHIKRRGDIFGQHIGRGLDFYFFSVGKEVRNPGSQHFFMDM